MSLFRRMSQVFQQKANATLNRVEDPAQALDLSYSKMVDNLSQVRRSVADVLTSQKRLESQQIGLQSQYDKLQGQARQALQQGQEDLAKQALGRAQPLLPQISALTPQIESLKQQQQSLEQSARQLSTKIEQFRAQRDTMKAQYTAAKASTAAMESLSGLSEQMTDVNMMMDRAKDKVEQMQARAQAVSQLAESGVLDSTALGGGSDDIEAALASGSPLNDVNFQLEQMKAELATSGDKAIGQANGRTPSSGALAENNSLVIRIAGESRYRVPSSIRPALEGLDTAMETAINANDSDAFSKCSQQLSKLIRDAGQQLDDTDMTTSDLVVPASDMTIAEAKKLMSPPEEAEAVDESEDAK